MTTPRYHLDTIFDPQSAHPDDAHSLLMRLIPENSRVLELGCASGYLSGYMVRSLGCHVTGLEVDPVATALAAEHCTAVHTVNLDSPDALHVAASDAPFDVLLAAAVLEHLKEPEHILQQARKLLKPGALVIVSLPNIAHWQFRLKLLFGKFDYTDYGVMDRTHTRLYTVKTGRELLENQGYRVEKLYIAGSLVQNVINGLARKMGRDALPPILPGLFAYELIYVARLSET